MSSNTTSAFEVVKSGAVKKSFSPEALVLRCTWASKKHSKLAPGEVVIDYFNSEFYGPFRTPKAKESLSRLLAMFDEDCEPSTTVA